MKKRYDLRHPNHDIYNNYYCRYKVESPILNSGAETIPSENTKFWDYRNLAWELLKLVGDEKGEYPGKPENQKAFIPYLTEQLQAIENQFEDYCQQKVNSGFEKPTEYPLELLSKKLQVEAKLDVLNGEVELIQKKLKEYKDREVKEDDSHVLQYGLQRSAKFWGKLAPSPELTNVLHILDGQLVSMHKDGFLIIDDARSPYNGMKISDYHLLAKKWVSDKLKADKEKLTRQQEEAKATGNPVPAQLPVRSPKKVSKDNLPKWPEWAINYKTSVTISKH